MDEQQRAPTTSRVGRRAGSASTRATVLAAATARFAQDGYTATTIRGIAVDAGVDPSQVMQFFGSKDELFAAVMAIPPSALRRFDAAFDGPQAHLGERVVRAFLEAWEQEPAESKPLMAMLRSAVGNEGANTRLRDFIQARLMHNSDQSDGEERALRAGLAAAMLVGVITSRQIVKVPAVRGADHATVIATVGPAIQTILGDR